MAARAELGRLESVIGRAISPAAREAINTWLDARGAARFATEGHDFELEWSEPAHTHMRFGLELLFGSHEVLLGLDGFAAIDPLLIGDPFALMPQPLRDLVAQRVLARFLATLPSAVAAIADVRAIHWQSATLPQWDCQLGFRLRRMPERLESQGILATATPAALLWLHRQLPLVPAATDAIRASLPVALAVMIGRTNIEMPQLRELAEGDVIWIETAQPSRAGLAAHLQTRDRTRSWSCTVKRASLHIIAADSADAAAPTDRKREDTMNAERAAPATLEIPVTFDLGELQVPVQELERIQPGRVFELPQEAAEAVVHLRVAGKLVAEGRLVTVGKRIGVRIAQVRM